MYPFYELSFNWRKHYHNFQVKRAFFQTVTHHKIPLFGQQKMPVFSHLDLVPVKHTITVNINSSICTILFIRHLSNAGHFWPARIKATHQKKKISDPDYLKNQCGNHCSLTSTLLEWRVMCQTISSASCVTSHYNRCEPHRVEYQWKMEIWDFIIPNMWKKKCNEKIKSFSIIISTNKFEETKRNRIKWNKNTLHFLRMILTHLEYNHYRYKGWWKNWWCTGNGSDT